jgi:hypothetical protein
MSTLRVNNVNDLGDTAVFTNGVLDRLALPAGSVLQVFSTTKTDVFTSSSLTFTPIPSFSVSITPTSASSKIMVFVDIKATADAATTNPGLFRLMRSSTPISVGDVEGSRIQVSAVSGSTTTGRGTSSVVINYLDSPSTTSPITYSVETRTGTTSQNVIVNRTLNNPNDSETGRPAMSITVMEIAG